MKEEIDFKKFEDIMNNAYKNSNFFDSQWTVERLKEKYSEKDIIFYLKKGIAFRRKNESQLNKEIELLRDKYKPRDYYEWEYALDFVSHYYKKGEHIFFFYGGISSGEIKKLTKKGYEVFIGRKLGIQPEISFKDVICHISNTKKILEVLKETDKK